MTDNLTEGIYLSGIGMGLVFLTLIAFMLILLLLKWVFPGEDIDTDEETNDSEKDMISLGNLSMADADMNIQQNQDSQGLGSKIAAMAVSLYLATEKDGTLSMSPENSGVHSKWNKSNRESFWDSQGGKSSPYGKRIYTPYDNRGPGL